MKQEALASISRSSSHDAESSGPKVKLCVFKSGEHDYKLQTIPKENGSFEAHMDLPESWRGKRDEELAKETGLNDAAFCHPAGFLAGFKSEASAVKAAETALGLRREVQAANHSDRFKTVTVNDDQLV